MLKGIFRTKNLDDILAAMGGPQFSLKRTLGAFNVTLIGIGAISGAGIFATVGSASAWGSKSRTRACWRSTYFRGPSARRSWIGYGCDNSATE